MIVGSDYMSSFKVTINCKKCNNEFPIIHHGIIDMDNEKELSNSIDNKTIFDFKCPKCGGEGQFVSSFLCYSKKKKYAIFFSNREFDEKQKHEQISNLGLVKIGDISDFTTRTVFTLEDLNEKISIFDNKLNDALIEAAKIWFVQNSDVKIEEIRFYKIVDDFIHWIVFYDGKIKGARLPMDFYRYDEKVWKVNIQNNFEVVNESTLYKFLTRVEE